MEQDNFFNKLDSENSQPRDYRLTADNAFKAKTLGLADANWYQTPIPADKMSALLQRDDKPAIRDTLIWFALLLVSATAGILLWPSIWALLPFSIYGVLYATCSDSRWHETSHGTAFKTDKYNNWLYQLASFMVFREATVWKWSHARHHSDTLVVGRDPEIVVQRPTKLSSFFLIFTGIPGLIATTKSICLHAVGKISEAEQSFIPQSEHRKVINQARIYLTVYLFVFASAIYSASLLPLMLIGLPTLYGSWLMAIYGLTQHTGLIENQLDHRLNCRTVNMNWLNRFLYWNMNFHIEHHMYPLVPYHKLPQLHALMKNDCPPAYQNLWQAWKEIIPAVIKQNQDPDYYVNRQLPATANPSEYRAPTISYGAAEPADEAGWIKLNAPEPELNSVIRCDIQGHTFAIYKTQCKSLYATDGICTHGNAHLADGLVIGKQIECPKHNGRFDITNGSCQRQPVCIALNTYPIKKQNNALYLNIKKVQAQQDLIECEVIQSRHLSTYIKEIELKPISQPIHFKAGQYIQLQIPPYQSIKASQFDIPERYLPQWQQDGVLDNQTQNVTYSKRNYSIANRPNAQPSIKLNVRIATAPPKLNCDMGIGSAYVFNLAAGDKVKVQAACGDFLIKETDKEMIYIGGGAGMAPLKSHISELFEQQKTPRKVSFWYGARTQKDIFYEDYFAELAKNHANFSYTIALSAKDEQSQWSGPSGYIHQVLAEQYLKDHPNPADAEYYLCGPPAMITATEQLLAAYKVPEQAISRDIFN